MDAVLVYYIYQQNKLINFVYIYIFMYKNFWINIVLIGKTKNHIRYQQENDLIKI